MWSAVMFSFYSSLMIIFTHLPQGHHSQWLCKHVPKVNSHHNIMRASSTFSDICCLSTENTLTLRSCLTFTYINVWSETTVQ